MANAALQKNLQQLVFQPGRMQYCLQYALPMQYPDSSSLVGRSSSSSSTCRLYRLCSAVQAVAHDQVGAPAAPPSLSMSALSGPAPSAAASVMAHGTTQPHPHQDCTSAVADGAPAGLHAMQGGNGGGGPRGTGAEGPEIWGSGGAEPGFSSTAPLLTAAADAGHSCTAAPSGAFPLLYH